uniref:Uncharacterized protein n=1 Tax=Phlebotomus papatasi TaxID=29031 RepID=A0A1B0GN70_PHLPP
MQFGVAKANVQAPVRPHQANVFAGPKVLEVGKGSISPAALDTSINCTDTWYSYCHDCRTIVVCAGEEKPIHAGACPSSAPYCEHRNLATCVSNPQHPIDEEMCDSSTSEDSQRCTYYGHTPDANDARVYYECHGPGDTNPIVHTCPEGYIFDTIDHNSISVAFVVVFTTFSIQKLSFALALVFASLRFQVEDEILIISTLVRNDFSFAVLIESAISVVCRI